MTSLVRVSWLRGGLISGDESVVGKIIGTFFDRELLSESELIEALGNDEMFNEFVQDILEA